MAAILSRPPCDKPIFKAARPARIMITGPVYETHFNELYTY